MIKGAWNNVDDADDKFSDIEIAKKTDKKELYNLQLVAFESEAAMIGCRNIPALLESYEQYCNDFGNWIVLIKRNDTGRIIASVRYKKNDNHVEIGRLMVSPNHRNKGIATQLIKVIESINQNCMTDSLY